MIWSEHNGEKLLKPRQSRAHQEDTSKSDMLQSLTIEYGPYNIIAQRVDAEHILVLISGQVPGRENNELLVQASKGDSNDESASGERAEAHVTAMDLQRTKARTLAQYISKQTKDLYLSGED